MNKTDLARNAFLLPRSQSKRGYMRWWHSFTGISPETGGKRVFFIEYFLLNPALGEDKPVLEQPPSHLKPHKKPSYFLMKAGAFSDPALQQEGIALHALYPHGQLKTALHPLILQTDDCFYSENKISGFVEAVPYNASRKSYMCDWGRMEWNLEVHKSLSCHTGSLASPVSSSMNTLLTYWHAEGMQTFYRGNVVLNGITYEVAADNCYGYADKHWGRSFNDPWVQMASSHIFSQTSGRELKHSAVAIDGCCPRFLCFRKKKRLLLQLTYEGEDYTFFLPRYRHPIKTKWDRKKTKSRLIWRIVAQNKEMVLKISTSCLNRELLELDYVSPKGKKQILSFGGNGEGTLLLYRRGAEGLVLVDTLTLSDVFCVWGGISFDPPVPEAFLSFYPQEPYL